MARRSAALALFSYFASLPAPVFAQAAPADWRTLWAGPMLLGGVLALVAIGFGLAFRFVNRVGVFLCMLVLTAGGLLTVYVMQGAVTGKLWQAPALGAGFIALAAAGQWALNRLARVDEPER